MTRLFSLAAAASLFQACDVPEYSDDPPEISGIVLACENDLFSVTVVAYDPNEVTNVTIDVSATGAPVATWYPLKDLDYLEGTSTWVTSDEALACDGTWELLVTATNLWGHSATETSVWPEPEVELDSVDPPWGSDAGGTVVTIGGEGLDVADRVTFDGVDATILVASEGLVQVSTPAGTAGTVDVEVHAGPTTASYPESFTYFEDASGLVSGIARAAVYLQDPARFAIGSPYTTLSSYDPFMQLDMIWHDPVPPEDTFLGTYPGPGSCEWGAAAYDLVDIGSFLYGHGDRSGTFVIPETGADSMVYAYVLSNIDTAEWPGQVVTLELGDEDALPLIELEDAVVYVDLLMDPSFAWEEDHETVRGEDFALSWTPDTLVEGVAYTIHAGTAPDDGATTLGTLECTADATTGSLILSWDEILASLVDPADEDSIRSLYTEFVFYTNTLTVLEHDNSEFWTRGELHVWAYWNVVEPPADSGLDSGL